MQIPQQQPSGKYKGHQLQRLVAVHTSKTNTDSSSITGTCQDNIYKINNAHIQNFMDP